VASPGNANPFPKPHQTTSLPLRETFLALFLFPHLVLLHARRRPRMRHAGLLAGIVLLACCLVLGLGRSPQALRQVGDTAAWLGRQMGELRRDEDGTLAWNRDEDAPTSLEHQGLKVDFAAKDSTFDLDKISADALSGLWISPGEVRFWTVGAGRFSWPAFAAASRWEALSWNLRFPPGSVIDGNDFAPLARARLRWSIPLFMTFSYLAAVLSVYLVFLAMFTVLPLILRQPRAPGEARAALCVNLYCSVVPLIVATAYHLALPRMLDFSTLFVFAFLGYLIWAYSRVRRFLGGADPRAG